MNKNLSQLSAGNVTVETVESYRFIIIIMCIIIFIDIFIIIIGAIIKLYASGVQDHLSRPTLHSVK